MGSPNPTRSRSFALIGHGGDGKTTLADSLLLAAGAIPRLGSVEDGTSFMNWLPEERARRVTISSSIATVDHADTHLTMIDAPGDASFAGDLWSALHAVDHAVIVVSAQDGVRVGTEKAWKQARDRGLTVTAVANKMDLERADFDAVAQQLEEAFGVHIVRLHLPLGRGDSFEGYVDLLSGQAYRFPRDGSGRFTVGAPPAELGPAIDAAHLAMVEAIAEIDDAVLEKYLEQGDIGTDELLATLHEGLAHGALLPLLCASATRACGGSALLEAAERHFPSPSEAPHRLAHRGEQAIELDARDDGPLAALVFKSVSDRYAGMLSILRVVSGTLHTDMVATNARTGTRERITKILRIHGDRTEEIKEVHPGEIAAIPKLKDTRTGDTLCAEKDAIRIAVSEPPRGVISFAVKATNKGDEEKVFDALHRLVDEDPSLSLSREERTGQFMLSGLGQLHIEVSLDRLRRLYGLEVGLEPPKVPYLETIRGRAGHVEGKLKKQSGGRGQYALCYLTVEPGERGSGVTFVDEIVGGSIPRQFIPAVEKGVRETCKRGAFTGHELTDIVVRCVDGKHHPVDSSEMAFKTAASLGLKAAVSQAKPTLLEPIMHLEITVPDRCVGDVMGDLTSRRGKVSGIETRGHIEIIQAHVPMAEVLSYASDLTSMTGGQGSFSMDLARYEEVPAAIRDKIVAESSTEAQAEH